MELKQAFELLMVAAANFRGTKQDHINLEQAGLLIGKQLGLVSEPPKVSSADAPELKPDEHAPV